MLLVERMEIVDNLTSYGYKVPILTPFNISAMILLVSILVKSNDIYIVVYITRSLLARQ